MKLNPKKCTFGVEEGMFLGYKVNTWGLKLCPDKVDAVLSLSSLKFLKDVQKLNGKLASLNRGVQVNEAANSQASHVRPVNGKGGTYRLFGSNKRDDRSSCTDGSGAGLILTNPEGMEFTYALRFMFDATNNEAKYESLIARLRIAKIIEAVIPTEISMPTLRIAEVELVQNNEALEINLDLLEERREQATICEAKSKAKMEKYYNSKIQSTSFKPGDLMYCNNDASHAEDTCLCACLDAILTLNYASKLVGLPTWHFKEVWDGGRGYCRLKKEEKPCSEAGWFRREGLYTVYCVEFESGQGKKFAELASLVLTSIKGLAKSVLGGMEVSS
nr:reverse transcriptase domain-containing protein [Tanacetum cinerariifolium]